MMPSQQARALLSRLRGRRAAMVRLLERFVRAESPTDVKSAVDRFGRMVAAEWFRRGARVTFLRQRRAGDHLRVLWPAPSGPHAAGRFSSSATWTPSTNWARSGPCLSAWRADEPSVPAHST